MNKQSLFVNIGPLHQVGVVIRLTIREARRRKMMWVALGMGVLYIGLFATGFHFAYQDYVNSASGSIMLPMFSNIFLTAGLYVVNFLIVILTALTTVGSVSGEIDSDTIHAIAAKPIRRWQIILGKWIGHALLVSLYVTLLTLGVIVAVILITGYVPEHMLAVLLILVLEGLTVLSLTLLGSSILNTLANGVVIFMLYGLAFVGGWVEQIGALMESPTAVDIGIASSLLLPTEALWRYAANLLQQSVGSLPVSPFSVTSEPNTAFIIYAGVYTLVLLGGAMWAFSRRDF